MDAEFGLGKFGKSDLAGWIPSLTDEAPRFDPLTTSAVTLQEWLTTGKILSVQILNEHYRQILAHNGYLKSIYQLAPRVVEHTHELDSLRARGTILGPMHGISVLPKDNIGTDTSFGMNNTGGALAPVGSTVRRSAPILDSVCILTAFSTVPVLIEYVVDCCWCCYTWQSYAIS
jgi:amidase